jgi:hypothetical protein
MGGFMIDQHQFERVTGCSQHMQGMAGAGTQGVIVIHAHVVKAL